MPGFSDLGKVLIVLGAFIAGIGVLLLMGDKIPWIGRLPGDILVKKESSPSTSQSLPASS